MIPTLVRRYYGKVTADPLVANGTYPNLERTDAARYWISPRRCFASEAIYRVRISATTDVITETDLYFRECENGIATSAGGDVGGRGRDR